VVGVDQCIYQEEGEDGIQMAGKSDGSEFPNGVSDEGILRLQEETDNVDV